MLYNGVCFLISDLKNLENNLLANQQWPWQQGHMPQTGLWGPHLHFRVVPRDRATVSTTVKWGIRSFFLCGVLAHCSGLTFVILHRVSGSLGGEGH